MAMERVILQVRRLWFGAREFPAGCATAVVESGGEILMLIDGDVAEADELVADAARRGSFVVTTSFTRPADMALRLKRAGYRSVQAHGTFVLDPDIYRVHMGQGTSARPLAGRRRGLLGLFQRPGPADVVVRQIGEEELPLWNAICWRAFGGRSSEALSLREKEQAFRAMGADARWYLATAHGRPAGTAILFQAPEAAQILAVGTLPGLRGRGVASAVMHRLIGVWQASGHGFLFLDTTPGSDAERLYRRLGFAPVYVREVHAPSRLSFLTED